MQAQQVGHSLDTEPENSCTRVGAAIGVTSSGLTAALYGLYHADAGPVPRAIGVVAAIAGIGMLIAAARGGRRGAHIAAVAAAVSALWSLAACSAISLLPELLLPVDLLSFSESPFITDIIKLRQGVSLYTPTPDNNSFPYSPGAQILTYAIARCLSDGTSITLLRFIQFGYVLAAVVVAAMTARKLARSTCRSAVCGPTWLWTSMTVPLLFLVATEARFNVYTHSLHNDGLVLLVTSCALWLILTPVAGLSAWRLAAMAALPAVGFCVKQSAVIWAPLFFASLLFTPGVRRTTALIVAASSAALVGLVVVASWRFWGDPYLEWVFGALGHKDVSKVRALEHGVAAAGFLALGAIGGLVLALEPGRRAALNAWLACLAVFVTEVYTSGVAVVSSHIGPGALLLTCWACAALPSLWPDDSSTPGAWLRYGRQFARAAILLGGAAALGLWRAPLDNVPRDFDRYVADIEREFSGLPADTVLLDTGSWIYLREGVLMKDRSAPVSLHVGFNQAEINRSALKETIERIRSRHYAKILAREIETPRTRYDFDDRGSGVKQAILENYRIVRRISPVEGAGTWSTFHLIAEIDVLEPLPGRGR